MHADQHAVLAEREAPAATKVSTVAKSSVRSLRCGKRIVATLVAHIASPLLHAQPSASTNASTVGAPSTPRSDR